jgi:outer membrane protein
MLIITILTLSLFGFSEVKIGVINGQDILQKTKRGKESQRKLENLGKSKRQQIEAMQNDLKKLQTELASPALNDETKRKKNRELEDQKINYDRIVQDAQKDFQEQQQKEMMALYKEIMPLIQQVGKSKGFSLILDLTTAGVAYFDEAIDITEEVIIAVDAKFPGK